MLLHAMIGFSMHLKLKPIDNNCEYNSYNNYVQVFHNNISIILNMVDCEISIDSRMK